METNFLVVVMGHEARGAVIEPQITIVHLKSYNVHRNHVFERALVLRLHKRERERVLD